MKEDIKTSLLVLNFNGRDLLSRYLPSVTAAAAYNGPDTEVVVVDNASSDGSVEMLRENFPRVRIHLMEENRCLYSYNEAVAACSGRYVVLLNNDVEASENFLPPLLAHFRDPKVFAVMPLIDSDNTEERYIHRSPGEFRRGVLGTGRERRLPGPGNTLFAHGGAAVMERVKFLSLGGFNELYMPFYYEEVDLCYRAWMRGWKVVFEPAGRVFHLGGASIGPSSPGPETKRRKYFVRCAFVLLNISDGRLIGQFLFWTLLRTVKAAACGDLPFIRALAEIIRTWPELVRGRRKVQTERVLSDAEIFAAIENGGGDN